MDWRLKELLDKLRAAGFEVDRTTGHATMRDITVEDAYVTGEFDTSAGGTSAGVRIEGDRAYFHDANGDIGGQVWAEAIGGGASRIYFGGRTNGYLTVDSTDDVLLNGDDVTVDFVNSVVFGLAVSRFTLSHSAATFAVPVKIGSSGTAVRDRRRFVINYNPASVAANTSTFFDIPLGETLPGTNSEWTVGYKSGLHSTVGNQLSFSSALLTAAMDTIRLYTTNPHAAAVDLAARDFVFVAERWA